MGLQEYRKKRRFDATPEPSGLKARRSHSVRALAFVVQKHRATQLHYDFRLEWGGVLLSWAVPKGPSLDPVDKRLARQVEDHPLDYADFEGTIPEGEYGGGTVMVWDRGTYISPDEDVGRGRSRGEIKFELHGRKLKGSWVLVRLRGGRGPGNRNWLLIKHRDAYASNEDITISKPCSVLSGRSLSQIALDEGGDVEKAASGDPASATRCRRVRRKTPGRPPRRRAARLPSRD